MLEIEQILSKVEDASLQKNLLAFHNTVKPYFKDYPAHLKGCYDQPGDLGIFTRQVMNFALSIFLNDASDGDIDFSMDDVILVSFAACLDAIGTISRIKVDKKSKDKKDEEFTFIPVVDWSSDPHAVVVGYLAQAGILLSTDQIHALVFKLGGWSPFREAVPDISQLAAVIHAAYLLALKFKVSPNGAEEKPVQIEKAVAPAVDPSNLL